MNQSVDFAAAAVQSLAALVLVLVVMAAVYLWIRRRLGPAGAGASIKVVASAYLGVRKSICVVDVMGSLLVLGISRDDIRLLDRLEPSSLAPVPPVSSAPKGFAAQLKQILAKTEGRGDA